LLNALPSGSREIFLRDKLVNHPKKYVSDAILAIGLKAPQGAQLSLLFPHLSNELCSKFYRESPVVAPKQIIKMIKCKTKRSFRFTTITQKTCRHSGRKNSQDKLNLRVRNESYFCHQLLKLSSTFQVKLAPISFKPSFRFMYLISMLEKTYC